MPRQVQDEDGVAQVAQYKQDKKMYYYEGSYLPVEWTNQHGCGRNSKANCEIVLQYMCEDTADPLVDNFWPYTTTKNCASGGGTSCGAQAFRSGEYIAAPRDGIPTSADDAATDTIPDTNDAAVPDTAADRRYGMHENYGFYELCQRTERNKGLYTADQRVRRNDQRGTRQNPNGNRRGLECPEERDYYPWWHPSPWVDVAVLTNDAGNETCAVPGQPTCSARCNFYLENSFNVAAKGYCDVAHDESAAITAKTTSNAWNGNQWYNNEAACVAAGFTWFEVGGWVGGFTYVYFAAHCPESPLPYQRNVTCPPQKGGAEPTHQRDLPRLRAHRLLAREPARQLLRFDRA
jgi:hypothetical protein